MDYMYINAIDSLRAAVSLNATLFTSVFSYFSQQRKHLIPVLRYKDRFFCRVSYSRDSALISSGERVQ